jgi:ABC-2 type transport system ATP-binding protein
MQLTATNVGKILKGNTVLSNINLDLKSGNIYGFVGPNGSGKTMLFRALSGLMSVSSGVVKLDGKVVRKDFSVLPNLGILLENVSLYPNLTGYENLLYLAKFTGKATKSDLLTALERVGLDFNDKRKYGKYSLGMKQRLAIAQAIMEHPDILMLDEPTNALDSEAIERVRQVIEEEKERGALILLASHNKDDIQILADQVFYLENGSIVDRR